MSCWQPTDASDELRRELQNLVKARRPYKYPRRLEFVDSVPRDAVGKVRRESCETRCSPERPPPGTAAMTTGAALTKLRRTSRRGLSYVVEERGHQSFPSMVGASARDVWMYLEHALVASGYTVITPDLAGFGPSDVLPPRDSLRGYADDETDLLDELEVQDPTLVGFAFGAGVILSAGSYERVGALVSIGIPSPATAPYDRMRGSILRESPLLLPVRRGNPLRARERGNHRPAGEDVPRHRAAIGAGRT